MNHMIDDILAQISPEDLAAQLGTDQETAVDAARKALPALLGGLSGNVDAGGGEALGAALQRDHDGSLLDRPHPLLAADPDDGSKIIGHIFGNQQDRVVDNLGAMSRGGSSLFSKLLPILAPLVMAWLGKRLGGALGGALGGGDTAPPAGSVSQSGGGLGDLLGQLTGRQSADASGGAAASGSGGGLGDLLGSLLGGEVEASRSSGPDIGSPLDLLGGGKSSSGT